MRSCITEQMVKLKLTSCIASYATMLILNSTFNILFEASIEYTAVNALLYQLYVTLETRECDKQ